MNRCLSVQQACTFIGRLRLINRITGQNLMGVGSRPTPRRRLKSLTHRRPLSLDELMARRESSWTRQAT